MIKHAKGYLLALLIGFAGLAGPAAADEPVTHFNLDVTFPDFVTCLDGGPLFVWVNLVGSGTFHGDGPGIMPPNGFRDGNGGIHIQRLIHYAGTIQSDDGNFLWQGHGIGNAIWNGNGSNAQTSVLGMNREVWLAAGDYPNLLATYNARFVVDANGNFVIAEPPSFSYRCLP